MSLLAMAVCQSPLCCQDYRYREQAHSYRFFGALKCLASGAFGHADLMW
ncbi:hypothetical protein EMIT0P294_70120 [Pseudomonas sp. IT-P294]